MSKGRRFLSLFLVMAMIMSFLPISASAAVGDPADVSTGLTDGIDTNDTISLPIKILDYEADGMMFEFAESVAVKDAEDFGANYYYDFDASSDIGYIFSSSVSITTDSNDYDDWIRLTWAKNPTSNVWNGGNAAVLLTDFGEDTPADLDDIQYAVIVYRTNVASDTLKLSINDGNSAAGSGNQASFTMTQKGVAGDGSTTNWTYGVYDLKSGGITSWTTTTGIYAGLNIDKSGEYLEIAHVAYFDNEDQAYAYGEYALTDGSDRGDNRAFGLLRGSRDQTGTIDFTGIDDVIGNGVQMLNTYSYIKVDSGEGDYLWKDADSDNIIDSTEVTYVGFGANGNCTKTIFFEDITGLGYQLLGTFGERGIANVGLLESGLSAEGNPVYKKEVVDYVASLLKDALEVSERTTDGWKNYRYIKGTASPVYGNTDLASALRNKVNKTTGSYAEASKKDLVGTWAEVGGNIASYYDAAYFLLNSIFIPGSYNAPQDDYNYLILSAGTDKETGDKVYVFDGGFAENSTSATSNPGKMAIDYDDTNHTIQNTSAAYKAHFYYETTNTTTLNPFLPVTDRNTAAGMTLTPYYQDDGVINGVKKTTTKDTLYKRNFGFAMVSEGEFVYHADDELFFEFEGDDDVYLFINNQLVMDIGSAHSIDIVRFNLNDYVNAAKAGTLGSTDRNEALALEEGSTYSFKFYYMERHSYGSNIRICTNIRVTDPSMTTAKTAWQDGTQLDFGSVVDPKKVVEYGFAITNSGDEGDEHLFNLTFTDSDIGVTLDPTNGLTVQNNGSRVFDLNDGTLEASDLTAVVTHPDYADINVTFADNAALKKFLADLTASGTEAGGGLFIGATVQIRGIGYKLTDKQVAEGVFNNTVLTTATNSNSSKTLHGQASMRVYVPADPMYYEWAGHDLKITKSKLIGDVMGAISDSNNPLYDPDSLLRENNVNKIELVTKAGTAITSDYVKFDSSYNMTVNYPTAGSKVFYVKITYSTSQSIIVPVLVNVTAVEDSVFVLDYGLKVDLTENGELTKNDTLVVPGRDTISSILGIGANGAYSPNEITFSSADNVTGDYGTFAKSGETITYTPSDFIEGVDTVQVAVNVYESDAEPSKISGTLDINNEVEMYKDILVLPANVVYYEDDFPAIKYSTDNTITKVGSGSGDKSQNADQSENYGHDDAYGDDTEDAYSGGSLTKITINEFNTAASFTFKGTGFELIGRTNATDAATLIVKVLDSNGNVIKTIPVINQFDNENNGGTEGIYQVPVIRVDDLEIGIYTVEISGVPAYNYDENGNNIGAKDTILYVDGLRIFNPILGDANEDYYLETEQEAQFYELRDQIVQGIVAVAKYSDSNFTVSTTTSTWTENLSGETEDGLNFNEVDSVEDYLIKGPNNEVYMTGTYDIAALVFYVKETGAGAHSLQIALRAIDETLFLSGIESEANATVRVGVYKDNAYAWDNIVESHNSSTEQYYSIDYTKCFYDEGKGAYQIVIRVDNGMVSYSSLKLVGLELVAVEGADSTDLKYVNGILSKYIEDATSEDAAGTNSDEGKSSESTEETPDPKPSTLLPTTPGSKLTGVWVKVDASRYVNFLSVREQMASILMLSDLEDMEPEQTEDETSGESRQETIDALVGFLRKFRGN